MLLKKSENITEGLLKCCRSFNEDINADVNILIMGFNSNIIMIFRVLIIT